MLTNRDLALEFREYLDVTAPKIMAARAARREAFESEIAMEKLLGLPYDYMSWPDIVSIPIRRYGKSHFPLIHTPLQGMITGLSLDHVWLDEVQQTVHSPYIDYIGDPTKRLSPIAQAVKHLTATAYKP